MSTWRLLNVGILMSLSCMLSVCTRSETHMLSGGSEDQEVASLDSLVMDAASEMIYHDRQGQFWFSSMEKGVYRYDGKNLRVYTRADGIGSYRILSVQEDDEGNLYFDTPIAVFRYSEGKFSELPVAELSDVRASWKSDPGDLWFRMGWENKGPYRFTDGQLYPVRFPKSPKEDEFYEENPSATINPYAIYSMYRDSRGNIWFGTSNMGLYLYDGHDISWAYEKHWTETPEGGNFGIRSIAEDSDGYYWISNSRYKYSLLSSRGEMDTLPYIQYNRLTGLENDAGEDLYFYAMDIDLDGNLLMMAGESEVWIKRGDELRRMYIMESEGAISPRSMHTDNNGVIWLSTSDGLYLYYGDGFEKFYLGQQ